MLWNEHFATDEDKLYYTKMTFKQDPTIYRHKMYTLLTTFATDIMRDVLSPDWSGNMEYVSSSRVDVKRLYTLELHNDFSSLLKRYFDKKSEDFLCNLIEYSYLCTQNKLLGVLFAYLSY